MRLSSELAKSVLHRVLENSMPEPMSGCLIWLNGTGNSGYGKFRIGHSKDYQVHRIAYAAQYGDIPEKMCVLHRCDVRTCVNPNHLFLGTHKENTRDMMSKGEHYSHGRTKTVCPKGHAYNGINSNGARICKICCSQQKLNYEERRRAQ